jgi:excisionase family DNA binding protein
VEGEGGETETIPLPSSFLQILAEALSEVSEGRSVHISPAEEELTTREAADLLNVSRPYLVKLLDERTIPHRKVGTHRRVLRRDVVAYKERMRVDAEEAMQELADQAQKLGLGYQ